MSLKRMAFCMLLLAWLAAACAGTGTPAAAVTPGPTPANEVTYETPSDVIKAYFTGIAQNDIRLIEQTLAIDEVSEKFKFDQYTARLRALQPVQSLAPAEYPFYVELNRAQLTNQFYSRVKMFAFSLLSSEEVDEGKTIIIDAARIDAFLKDVDPKKLAGLELKKIGPPEPALMLTSRYVENAAQRASIYGADEATERVALFSFEGQDYYVGFTLLRYGDNWKIISQDSTLAGTDWLGIPQKTTLAEFEQLISSK